MKLYVAMVQDRHSDPVIRVFSTLDLAIAWTRREFAMCVKRPTEIKEDKKPEPWLYYATYGHEGDYAGIEETTLDLS